MARSRRCLPLWSPLAMLLLAAGCASPYHADRGALFGGLTGAGIGALVGNAAGSPGAGAAIGAGVGALTGGAIGAGLDEVEARNRAEIEARLGRQVAAGAVTIEDVIAMTKAGVDPELIVTHVRAHGPAAPLTAGDLIYLQEQGVATRVVQAMQMPPQPREVVQAVQAPPPVIVEELACSPETGPCGMRVSSAPWARRFSNDEQEAQAGADHPQAA